MSEEDTRHLLENIMDDEAAPSANDAARPWPSARRHAMDRERDAELADVLNRTEIMAPSFHKEGHACVRRSACTHACPSL